MAPPLPIPPHCRRSRQYKFSRLDGPRIPQTKEEEDAWGKTARWRSYPASAAGIANLGVRANQEDRGRGAIRLRAVKNRGNFVYRYIEYIE